MRISMSRVAALAVAAMLAAACAGDSDDVAELETDAADVEDAEDAEDAEDSTDAVTEDEDPLTVVWSQISETPTLDPAVIFSTDGLVFARNVYEGLVEFEPFTNEVRPGLATEWEVADDDVTYTFHLREGVSFHDGSELNAEVAAAGLQRIIDVNQGPATNAVSIESVRAAGEMELELVLRQPDFTFMGRVGKLPIVSLQAWEENATDDDPLATEWFTENAAGTGPYELADWERNQAIHLTRYDGYWRDWDPATPERVVIRLDPDVATSMQLLQAGEVDMLGSVGPDDSARAETIPGVQLIRQPSFEVRKAYMNVNKEPMDDVRVREAISLAFDYQAMADFYQGFGEIPRGPVPSGLDGQGDLHPPMEQDMDRARELLTEAGYPDGGFEVDFLGLAAVADQEFAANILTQQLGELGITVRQNLNPWPQMVEIQSNPDAAMEMSFQNHRAQAGDPASFLRTGYATSNQADRGGWNWGYYSNPTLDAMLDEYVTIEEDAERVALASEMIQMVRDDHVGVYVIEPTIAQPVREGWEVWYESLEGNNVVRFFFTRYDP